MIIHLLIFFTTLILSLSGALSATSWAETSPTPQQPSEDLEIKADENLIWDRANKNYKATGNAKATQKGMNLDAAELVAEYGAGGDITIITALGNVFLKKEDIEGTAEKAVYNVQNNFAIMTGNNLKITMPQRQLTARDSIEYNITSREVVARGEAFIINQKNTLKADIIKAWLDENNKLERAEALGNVLITTPSETAKAGRAVYNAQTNMAELFDNVDIQQGQNRVKGARAEVDLTKNISKIFGNGNENRGDDSNRVRAVFFPKE